MNIEEQLNSDDIEVAALYADILLKKNVKEAEELIKQSNKYKLVRIGRGYYLNPKYEYNIWQVNTSGWSNYTPYSVDEAEGIKLNYRDKKEETHLKKPMFNNFLQPKKYLKYGNK